MSAFSDDNAIKKFKSGTEAFDAKSNNGEKTELQGGTFKEATPNIVNNKGYNIPINVASEQQVQLEQNVEAESDIPVIPAEIVKKPGKNIGSVSSVPLLHKKTYVQKQSVAEEKEFIHYDFIDKAGERVFEHENPMEHDKYARNEKKTDAGGGAKFEATYDKKGKLHSKISLSKGRDRTDQKGFRNKAISFSDKASTVFEDVRPENQDALASIADAKIETAIQHSSKRHFRKKDSYKEIEQSTKEEIKQLKKEIKAEKVEKENQSINSYFNQSDTTFSNEMEDFSNLIDERFHSKYDETEAVQALFIETEKDGKKESVEKAVVVSKADHSKGEGAAANKNGVATSFNSDTVSPQFESRSLTRQEKLEQSMSENKAAKKSERKEFRKAAALTAVSKMLEGKKDIQNQLGDMSGQGTGDLLKDGSSGLLKTFTNSLKQAATDVLKSIGGTLVKYFASLASSLFLPICFIFLIVAITMATFTAVGGLLGSDSGESYDLDVNGDGYLYTSLSDETLESIIAALYENYSDMSAEQEQMLRYALSKVGCAYDQDYHGNLHANIFDCSSLAYRAYRDIGMDISNNGAYSAAEECHAMMNAGKTITGDMKPGDLIFYGGKDNGRYMGIYHVAIYVGRVNGVDKMVEARGTSYGVVYCDVRTNNVVNISRPI
jgi:hypothetical protein